MCLGEVGQVLDVSPAGVVEVRVGELVRTVLLLTLEAPVSTGDWLLVHSGFALRRLSADEAREAQRIRGGS
jgi:hydrogenase assembly chaperone HypC/HupF